MHLLSAVLALLLAPFRRRAKGEPQATELDHLASPQASSEARARANSDDLTPEDWGW